MIFRVYILSDIKIYQPVNVLLKYIYLHVYLHIQNIMYFNYNSIMSINYILLN